MFDNKKFHKKNEIKLLIKKLWWVVFTIPTYCPKLNQIRMLLENLNLRY